MTAVMETKRGQRSASGFDFWYEGRDEQGEVVVSPNRMKQIRRYIEGYVGEPLPVILIRQAMVKIYQRECELTGYNCDANPLVGDLNC